MKSGKHRSTAERVVKDIRRKTRRLHSAEEKIHIVLEGLRGEYSIAELCRREGIATSLYYKVRKQIVELALEEPELSPRELAVRFTDTKRHYISEASAYRILKERD